MKNKFSFEGLIFLAINLAAPILYGLMFWAIPREIALYVSVFVFVLLQALNVLRIFTGNYLSKCYIGIIFLNAITLIAVGNIAFLSSIPAFWGVLTSLQ